MARGPLLAVRYVPSKLGTLVLVRAGPFLVHNGRFDRRPLSISRAECLGRLPPLSQSRSQPGIKTRRSFCPDCALSHKTPAGAGPIEIGSWRRIGCEANTGPPCFPKSHTPSFELSAPLHSSCHPVSQSQAPPSPAMGGSRGCGCSSDAGQTEPHSPARDQTSRAARVSIFRQHPVLCRASSCACALPRSLQFASATPGCLVPQRTKLKVTANYLLAAILSSCFGRDRRASLKTSWSESSMTRKK